MTLRIEVELSPVFQTACSSLRLSVELDESEATVKGLLHHLSKEYGEKMSPLLFERGKASVLPGLMVMVNERIFTGSALNQQVVELHDRDKVNLLYFVSGG